MTAITSVSIDTNLLYLILLAKVEKTFVFSYVLKHFDPEILCRSHGNFIIDFGSHSG